MFSALFCVFRVISLSVLRDMISVCLAPLTNAIYPPFPVFAGNAFVLPCVYPVITTFVCGALLHNDFGSDYLNRPWLTGLGGKYSRVLGFSTPHLLQRLVGYRLRMPRNLPFRRAMDGSVFSTTVRLFFPQLYQPYPN